MMVNRCVSESTELPIPIFVLGKHRSGTTWLANLLCAHPLIAGVQHERHFGIHESAYFSCLYNRYGDLTNRNNFIEFVEVISASDYFRLAGVTKDFLYSLYPTTYESFFRTVMDDYAIRQRSAYWVEKSPPHSLIVHQLAAFYPDAKFVYIVRDVAATVASTMALRASRNLGKIDNVTLRRSYIIRTTLSWTYYNKVLITFGRRSERALGVHYETLRSNQHDTLRLICDFLGLSFESKMCDLTFAPNTSFTSGADGARHSRSLSSSETRLLSFMQRLFDMVPLCVLSGFGKMKQRKEYRRPLPTWFFSMFPFFE
jgi:hypothetical protein